MNNFSWYISRLRTMSAPELVYRAAQFAQKQREKRSARVNHAGQDYNLIARNALPVPAGDVPGTLAGAFDHYNIFPFFIYTLPLDKAIDWHLDISSGKRFPMSFSKDINIRSDQYGSAKVVWEFNRLQFLLPIAIRYHAHRKREDLDLFMRHVNSWVKENPYLSGVNWYSNIEVNIRLIVWYFCWQVLQQDASLQQDTVFSDFVTRTWLPSIYEHCVYSHANPSKYSSANNHLVAEYAGLFVASCCWDFKESKSWNVYAKKGLEKEFLLQYSANGINKEEAAEYIQFISDFFLVSYAVGDQHGIGFSDAFKARMNLLFTYLTDLLDTGKGYRKYGDEDDGKVLVVSEDPHFDNFSSLLASGAVIFNDGRFKARSNGYDLKNWLLWGQKGADKFNAVRPEQVVSSSAFYKDEGQFFFKKGDGSDHGKEIYLHMDAAPLGFLSIAAHGHADALSVALHIDGHPVIADTGTYTYHTDKAWRNYFISTLAHNTICIDGKNQALQAGPTMWLDHYTATVKEASQMGTTETVAAIHNGYRKLGCSHERRVTFYKDKDRFLIEDRINTGGKPHSLQQPWHLHPAVHAEREAGTTFVLHTPGARSCRITCDPQLQLQLLQGGDQPGPGWYSPSFMKKEKTSAILGILESNHQEPIILQTIIEII